MNGSGPYPGGHLRYGSGTRHVRCDVCLRAYLPQHVNRRGMRGRWWWVCGNCISKPIRALGRDRLGYQCRPEPYARHRDRWAEMYETDAPLSEREAVVMRVAGVA